MTTKFSALVFAAALAATAPAAFAAPVAMTFEEFADGATNVDGFYGGGLTWLNETVLNSAGTPAQSPFSGPLAQQANVLTLASCGALACELELLSTSAIDTIMLSGLISSGPNLEIRAFNGSGQQVGSALVIDTELQSVGCAIPTDWSCDRVFSFTQADNVRRLQFITSGAAMVDNVEVTTFQGGGEGSLPEPASVTLAALGLLIAFAHRRHKLWEPVRRGHAL
jgi:hypothetical protein